MQLLPILNARLLSNIVAMLGFALVACTSERRRDRTYANEMAAIRSLHILNVVQMQYLSAYQRYAVTLAELGPPPRGEASIAAADLVPTDLASGTKAGYLFKLAGTRDGYTIHADPQIYGQTGTRSFYTDQTRFIREHRGNAPANVNDREIGRTSDATANDREIGGRRLPVPR